MSFEITGQVVAVGALQSRVWEGKTFNNRSIIISFATGDQGEYVKHAEFDVAEKQFEHLDRNQPGDTVTIKFSIEGGKPYTNNKSGQLSVFNKLRAFYIGNESQGEAPQEVPLIVHSGQSFTIQVPVNEDAAPTAVTPVGDGPEDIDCPF